MPGKSSRGWQASFRTVAVAGPAAAMSCSDVVRHYPPQVKLSSAVAAASCPAAPASIPALPFTQSQQVRPPRARGKGEPRNEGGDSLFIPGVGWKGREGKSDGRESLA